MKSILFMTVLAMNCSMSFGQEDPIYKQYFGLECLGNLGAFSFVYGNKMLSSKSFSLELRTQFSALPGDSEGGLPSHAIPFVGLNGRLNLFKEMISLNLNSGVGVAFNWGNGSYGPRIVSAIAVGPKFRTGFGTWGLAYVYFLKEPEYFYFDLYPHSVGLSIEFEF